MDTLSPSPAAKTDVPLQSGTATCVLNDDWFRPCVLLVVDRPSPALADTLQAFLADDLPCLLVDTTDGNAHADQFAQLAAQSGVQLVRSGRLDKGAALLLGLEEAARAGFSHVAEVDADGRDDVRQVALFLDRASQAPDAVICSYPQTAGADLAGRCLAWLGRHSASARTLLCELRVYPLAATLSEAQNLRPARSSDFGAELLVQLHRRNTPLVWLRMAPRACRPGQPAPLLPARLARLRLLIDALLR